ncbi:MAG: MarR family EPS-associated transcriptional regulator [Candidatus Omnitrophota bacterium]
MIEQSQEAKNNFNSEEAFLILRELYLDPQLTQRDLAQKIGISLGKTNYLIKELGQKGLVKIKNFSHKEQKLKRISYILTPKGLKEKAGLTLHFLQRKQQEYESLRREWENLERVGVSGVPGREPVFKGVPEEKSRIE